MASIKASVAAALFALPSALAANLLVSHFSGNLYSLSLTTSGETGTLTLEQTLRAGGTWPSWLTLDSEAGLVYVVDESTWGRPILTQLPVGADGKFGTAVTAQVAGGNLHSSLYGGENGKSFLAAAGFETSSVNTFKLPVTSSTEVAQTLTFTMDGPGAVPDRQNKPHPHSAFVDPAGKYIVSGDLGADLIRVFSIDAASGKLTSCGNFQTGAGDGPRHGAWWVPKAGSTDGTMLYMVNELSNAVTVWTVEYAEDCLALKKTQSLPTAAEGKTPPAGSKAAEVRVAGNFVYATNRNDQAFGETSDSVATYSIDPDSGAITFVESTDTHTYFPRTFEINKAGDMVVFGGQTSSSVAVVARDPATGRLGDLIASLQVGSPGTVNNEDGLSSVIWQE